MKILVILTLVVIGVGLGTSTLSNHLVYADISVMPTPLWTPVIIGNSTVPLGTSEFLSYTLKQGITYHVFLVGNWTEPSPSSTDYDVYVSGPNEESYRFTEASGLPEQVFNDGKGQLFTPKSTGVYNFEIRNDDGNSKSAESAVFMLIEHVETDRLLNATLLGRTSKSGAYPLESQSTYACEFTTNATSFIIHVDTPKDIDLYEARLYKMATLGNHGHDLYGLSTPIGSDLISGNVTDGYGGYNFAIDGMRPELYASGYDYGVKMNINATQINGGVGTGASPPSTYFLVLIAEYSKTDTDSIIPFYIKTNTSAPSPTLGKPLGTIYSGEETKFYINVTSPRPVVRTWANFTINGVPTNEVVNLKRVGNGYEGMLPVFVANDTVKYSICSEDELGNVGKYDSSFIVKAQTVTQCIVMDPIIVGGESLDLYGYTTVHNTDIQLNFTTGKYKEAVTMKSNEFGVFQYSYTPKQPGNWTVLASYLGDSADYPSNSTTIAFVMTPQPTKIICSLPSSEIKVSQPLKLVGSTTPAVAGLIVNVLFASSSGTKNQTVTTSSDGSFSVVSPLEEGDWEMVAQVKGNWRYAASSSSIVKATVNPLSLGDKTLIAASIALAPPYVYIFVLASGICLVLIVRWKIDVIVPKLPKPIQALLVKIPKSDGGRERKNESGDRDRYHREIEGN